MSGPVPVAASPIRGLYAILDPGVILARGKPERAIDAALSGALEGGCRLVQYRDKTSPARTLLERANRFLAACRGAGAAGVMVTAAPCSAPSCHRCATARPEMSMLPPAG